MSPTFVIVGAGMAGGKAARWVDEDMADHIDMNFGCPVPKVTRRGGGEWPVLALAGP